MAIDDKTITITCSDPDFYSKRIDQFLTVTFPEYSRTYFQKLIADGLVLVGGKPVKKPSHSIMEHDEVSITFPAPKPLELTPQKVDFGVVCVQDDFLVINKPAGLVVHHTNDTAPRVTLVHGLLYAYKEFEQFEDNERPGIVHRLDKNTSGLILVARNPQSQATLSGLFKDRKIKKSYLALVSGNPPREGSIEYPIGRHPKMRHKMSHQGYNGRDALTHYKVLVYYKNYALVKCMPVTGRTHQIRVHMAAIGHGIVGDELYGVQSKFMKRQALHAWKLQFTYKGEDHFYCTGVPEDFASMLLRQEKAEK